MGRQLEVLMGLAGEPKTLVHLTERQLDVVLLIGRDGLSYKAAAILLSNRLVRARAGATVPHLSHHTVRVYANEIRDLFGLGHLTPLRAMWRIYQDHHESLEQEN